MVPKRRFIGSVVVATETPKTQNRNDETSSDAPAFKVASLQGVFQAPDWKVAGKQQLRFFFKLEKTTRRDLKKKPFTCCTTLGLHAKKHVK